MLRCGLAEIAERCLERAALLFVQRFAVRLFGDAHEHI
jgi:hypothetical protein